MEEIRDRIQRIKMLMMDVDGVMTDGGLLLGTGGMESKGFMFRMGWGLRWQGLQV